MFSLDNLGNNSIYMQDIKESSLSEVFKLYNQTEYFMYATGNDRPLDFCTFASEYKRLACEDDTFFASIYKRGENSRIGILKGRYDRRNHASIWIQLLIIDTRFQKHGYGRMSVELLARHLKLVRGIISVFLSVVEGNSRGKSFWNRLGFREVWRMDHHIWLNHQYQSVIVMKKKL